MGEEKNLTEDMTEIEGLEITVETFCNLSPVDRLGALAKVSKLQMMTAYLGSRMLWMNDVILSGTAFSKQDAVDEINRHLEIAARSMFEAWRLTVPYEPRVLPPGMEPKERPLLFPG